MNTFSKEHWVRKVKDASNKPYSTSYGDYGYTSMGWRMSERFPKKPDSPRTSRRKVEEEKAYTERQQMEQKYLHQKKVQDWNQKKLRESREIFDQDSVPFKNSDRENVTVVQRRPRRQRDLHVNERFFDYKFNEPWRHFRHDHKNKGPWKQTYW